MFGEADGENYQKCLRNILLVTFTKQKEKKETVQWVNVIQSFRAQWFCMYHLIDRSESNCSLGEDN